MELTKKQILEYKKEQLNEGVVGAAILAFIARYVEPLLMAAGFVPVIGEIADIGLIIYYLIKGEKLYAALMLIALVPVIGDITVKPLIKALQAFGKGIYRSGDDLARVIASNPKLGAELQKALKYVNHPGVQTTIKKLGGVKSSWASGLKEGLAGLSKSVTSSVTKIKPIGALKSAFTSPTSFRSGLKGFYQGERLTRYAARKGINPGELVKDWWFRYWSRQDRRNSFRKFIIANNLLSTFGLPSLSALEDKMTNDKKFREEKVADNPQMSSYIAQNPVPVQGQPQGREGGGLLDGGGGLVGGVLTLAGLKLLARLYT